MVHSNYNFLCMARHPVWWPEDIAWIQGIDISKIIREVSGSQPRNKRRYPKAAETPFVIKPPKKATRKERQEIVFDDKDIPESLKNGEGVVLVLNRWWPGGGAAMAGQLYAYLESWRPLPKTIVGSSIGSLMSIALREISIAVAQKEDPYIATAENILRGYLQSPDSPADSPEYAKKVKQLVADIRRATVLKDKHIREAMMWTLKSMFTESFPRAGYIADILQSRDFLFKWVKKLLGEADSGKLPASQASFFLKFFRIADFTISKTKAPFDVGIAYTLIDARRPRIRWNQITPELIDASSAFKEVSPVMLSDGLAHDGNYSDYLTVLARQVQKWQEVVFISSYYANDVDKLETKFSQRWLATLREKWANVQDIRTPIDQSLRGEMKGATQIFTHFRDQARREYGVKRPRVIQPSREADFPDGGGE